MKKTFLLLIAAIAIAFSSFAQAPAGFKYQAVIRDASSTIITDQSVGIRLSIQQISAGGTAVSVYTETFSPTTNAYGLVNLEIGSGTTTDDFSAIDWTDGPYFIETAVDAAGGTSYVIMGTSQLMSVPYALHATTADSALNDQDTQLTEVEVDAFVANNGYLTSFTEVDGDSTNEYNSSVVLNGTSLEITDGGGMLSADLSSLGGGGSSAGWTLTGTNISNNNTGNVGIGLPNPLQTFAIMKDSATFAIGNSAFNSPNSGALTFSEDVDNAGGDCGFRFSHDGAANTLSLYAGCFISSSSDTLIRFFRSGATASKRLRLGDLSSSSSNPLSVLGNADFTGNLTITGNLTVSGTIAKGGGTFKIDHPQDPANKYLVHSFVESPEMMNVYSGNITTDASGFATVQLPGYFEAANKDFRYQLTVMGTFAQAIVKEKISNNTFVIQTNEPNVEVSWQVTGVRADKFANENRVIAEQEKELKGTYIHPELYGVDASQQEATVRQQREVKAQAVRTADADQ